MQPIMESWFAGNVSFPMNAFNLTPDCQPTKSAFSHNELNLEPIHPICFYCLRAGYIFCPLVPKTLLVFFAVAKLCSQRQSEVMFIWSRQRFFCQQRLLSGPGVFSSWSSKSHFSCLHAWIQVVWIGFDWRTIPGRQILEKWMLFGEQLGVSLYTEKRARALSLAEQYTRSRCVRNPTDAHISAFFWLSAVLNDANGVLEINTTKVAAGNTICGSESQIDFN